MKRLITILLLCICVTWISGYSQLVKSTINYYPVTQETPSGVPRPAYFDYADSVYLIVYMDSSVTTSGSNVTDWADANGSGRDFEDETASGEGLPNLTVDGIAFVRDSGDYLETPYDEGDLVQPFTVISVLRQDAWTANARLMKAYSDNYFVWQYDSSPEIDIRASEYSLIRNGGLAVGDFGVVATAFNGANSYVQINDGTPGTGDAGTGTPNGWAIGGNDAGTANAGDVTFKFVLIYRQSLNKSQVDSAFNYLNDLYDLGIE